MNKLREILDVKAGELEAAKTAIPLAGIRRSARDAPSIRPFRAALRQASRLALIAEVKKASPSKGLIRADFDPAAVARAYRDAGADCLSVLTDARYFQGSLENLRSAREASGLPCLRKDFIVDPYQVYEARSWGADCILLIVSAFVAASEPTTANRKLQTEGLEVLRDLFQLGKELGMDILVEVHSRAELELALAIGADLIGVNNRDLTTMTTSLATSEELLPLIPSDVISVSESALDTRADLERVQAAGAKAVLIGSTFCASPDIGDKVREVMGW